MAQEYARDNFLRICFRRPAGQQDGAIILVAYLVGFVVGVLEGKRVGTRDGIELGGLVGVRDGLRVGEGDCTQNTSLQLWK